MKMLFKVITAFLYFSFASPVLMYYIYDDNPSLGYVSLGNGIVSYSNRNVNAFQRKAYPGFDQGFHKVGNYDRIVDSHFKVKSLPIEDTSSSNENTRIVKEETRPSEPPLRKVTQNGRSISANPKGHNVNQGVGNQNKNKHHRPINKGNEAVKNVPEQMKLRAAAEYAVPIRSRVQINQQRVTEKQKFIEMNVHKTQIPTQPQKVLRVNSDGQVGYVKNNFQRIQSSGVMDKTVHKTNSFNDRNSRAMSTVFDDMPRTINEKIYKTEYKKRDVPKTSDENIYEKPKHNSVSDNMRKYIGKDKNMEKEHRNPTGPANDNDENVDQDDPPYAVFYRTNPETFDQDNDFIVIGSADGSKDHGNKQKRVTVNIGNEIDYKKQKTRKNANTVKLHRKMKNFYNYKNVKK